MASSPRVGMDYASHSRDGMQRTDFAPPRLLFRLFRVSRDCGGEHAAIRVALAFVDERLDPRIDYRGRCDRSEVTRIAGAQPAIGYRGDDARRDALCHRLAVVADEQEHRCG